MRISLLDYFDRISFLVSLVAPRRYHCHLSFNFILSIFHQLSWIFSFVKFLLILGKRKMKDKRTFEI